MYHIIVNPSSRSGKGLKIWKDLESEWKGKTAYQVHVTKTADSVTDIMRSLFEGSRDTDGNLRIVVLGGDGTLNQVVQEIPEEAFPYLRIGYIPTGSSNDFARDLGLSKDRKALVRTILEDKVVRTLDVGVLQIHARDKTARGFETEKVHETKRFLVSSGIGFDAAVCEAANVSEAKKVLNRIGLGKLIYVTIAVGEILHSPQKPCRIRVDEKEWMERQSFLFAAAMNHRYEGGGFAFAPMADATDGILDLCVAGNISKAKFLYALPKALKGTHFTVGGIDHYAGHKIEIRTDIPMWVHTDGEVETSSDHVTFTCMPRCLRMTD